SAAVAAVPATAAAAPTGSGGLGVGRGRVWSRRLRGGTGCGRGGRTPGGAEVLGRRRWLRYSRAVFLRISPAATTGRLTIGVLGTPVQRPVPVRHGRQATELDPCGASGRPSAPCVTGQWRRDGRALLQRRSAGGRAAHRGGGRGGRTGVAA